MKKLRLNKLFHWLYAILMLAPLIIFIGTIVVYFATGANFLTEDEFSVHYLWIDSWILSFPLGYTSPVVAVFEYLVHDLFNLAGGYDIFFYPLVYWVYVSLCYLVFDVLMYPINLFHKWIDEGGF